MHPNSKLYNNDNCIIPHKIYVFLYGSEIFRINDTTAQSLTLGETETTETFEMKISCNVPSQETIALSSFFSCWSNPGQILKTSARKFEFLNEPNWKMPS